MIMKTEKATWIPPVEDGTSKPAHGWLDIDGKIWQIRDWHSFSDFGQTLETLTIERGNARTQTYKTKEIYSLDEGETFTFDAY
jgi:hypothetical protein